MPDPVPIRMIFHHFCGAVIHGEAAKNQVGPYSHYVFYTKKRGGILAQVCPECGGRIGPKSIRTQAEQERAQMAAESLELALDRQRQAEEEEPEDKGTGRQGDKERDA